MGQEAQVLAARKRGRPPGSGRDDGKALAAVADILQAHPGMKPTTAMRRQAGADATDTLLRRLQVKWKVAANRLLAEAAGRAQEKERRRAQGVAALAAQVSTMDNSAYASAVAGQYAHILESTGRSDWESSATAEAIRMLEAVERGNPAYQSAKDYGREMAWLGMDLTGSAMEPLSKEMLALSKEMADLSRIGGVCPI